VTTARLSDGGEHITIDSVVTFTWGAPGAKMTTKDTWSLLNGGKTLSIQRHVSSFRGVQDQSLVFYKQ